jgi:hypothetical protein
MKTIIKALLITIFATGFLASFQIPAEAAIDASKNTACQGVQGNCGTGASDVQRAIQNIINLITVVVGIVAVVMIIVNGFRLITSGGDSNTVTSARNGLIYAIVGLIVVVLAQVIVRFVLVQVQ